MKANNISYPKGEYLVETDLLAQQLNSPDLRIFDCTAYPSQNSDKVLRNKFPIKPESGLIQFQESHIPGAGYIDVPNALSDNTSEIPMMRLSNQKLIDVLAEYGISDNTRVVLYSKGNIMWATRVWWMLQAIGFDNATVLNGGWKKWVAEDKCISTEPCQYPPGKITYNSRTDLFVDKNQVLTALGNNNIRLIHALPFPTFAGTGGVVFGRKGHIPGSVNVPAESLHDTDSGQYLHVKKLREKFDAVAANDAKQIIVYCGGGVNATNNAFALTLLGYTNVAVYDGSMNEWGNDESLPIESL